MNVNIKDIKFDNPVNNGTFGTHYYQGEKFTGVVYEGNPGAIISAAEIVNGLQNGFERCYYPSGALESEIHFKDGFEDGIAKYFHENGVVKEKIDFKNGHGLWYELYDESGVLIQREEG